MSKEFESEIAKKVSRRRKGASKAIIALTVCVAALVMVVAATTVAAAGNMNGNCDQTRDQLKDGSCLDSDCDGIPDQIRDRDQLRDGSCQDDDGEEPVVP